MAHRRHLHSIFSPCQALFPPKSNMNLRSRNLQIGENAEDGEFVIHTYTVDILLSHLLHLANLSIQEAVKSD
jgi:hypothetical protein